MRNPLRGALHRSFLERNQVVIGVVGTVVVAVLSGLALMLTGGVFQNTYEVTAFFEDAAAIRPGDSVTVAGLDAGQVDDVRLSNDRVAIDLAIDSDVRLTKDTEAEIKVETLLGKKVIALEPGGSAEPLSDGDTIPLDRTHTPIEIVHLTDTSVNLMEKSNAQALDHMLAELTKVTAGKQLEVRRLISGLTRVTRAVDAKRAELKGLIDSLDTLSGTFAASDDTIVQLIDRYDAVLGNLARHRGDLKTLLESTDYTAHEVAGLVHRKRGVLGSSLRDLHTVFQLLDKHQIDLAEAISYLEASVRGYASVGYSQSVPNHWANIYIQSLGPLGIDQIFGPCGTFDKALDKLLGPDPRPCEERGSYRDAYTRKGYPASGSGDSGGSGDGESSGDRTHRDPGSNPSSEPALPGTLRDLVGELTGDIPVGGL